MVASAGSQPGDDDALARAFAARVPAALDETYRRFGGMLVAVARRTLGAPGDAEDCVHDALLRIWTAPHAYRPERGPLRAFLLVCVRNEALTRVRNAARRREIDRQIAHAAATEPESYDGIDPVETARLRSALASLSDEQRRVIDLAYFADLSQTQIAAALDVPLGTVKSRASLGLRRLSLAMRQKREPSP